MRREIAVILYTVAVVGMTLAGVDAGRLAWADWLAANNTPESVARALRLDPANATLHGLLAEHQEALGQDPKPELEIATALSPAESRYWERLGFRAEVEHDDAAAEKYLLHAAAVDQMFAPRWSLANFYLRRGDTRRGDIDNFWKWLGKSAEMSPPDLSAIFQLAWAVSQDGKKIQSILPADRSVRRLYVAWLVGNRPVSDTTHPALKLAADPTSDDVSILLAFCDKAALVDMQSAVEAWNSMCARKLLPYRALDPRRGPVVTNSSFSEPPSQRGFDWNLMHETGTSSALAEAGNGLVIRLSGKQAERTPLLLQLIPLAGAKHYRLSFEYRVTGTGGPTGLRWEVRQPPRDLNLIAAAGDLRSTEWKTGSADFESADESASRLMLFYQREPGMVPWEGAVYLRKVNIEVLP